MCPSSGTFLRKKNYLLWQAPWLFILIIHISLTPLEAQIIDDDEGNKKPRITGQRSLSTDEEKDITILMTDLEVEDRDNLYPIGFTMRLYSGDNYSFSGHTVSPEKDFAGTLTVPVSVNDGEDESEKFDLKITVKNVNDGPVITGQDDRSTDEDQVFVIQDDDLEIHDPDDDVFSVYVGPGANYTVNGQSVKPAAEFSGSLAIPVRVNDGEITSPEYTFTLEVKQVNDVPKITGQQPVSTSGGVPVTIQLSHLTVQDPDNSYPSDFTLKVLDGDDYNVSGNQVTPDIDFAGNLTVGVRVNDGDSDSDTYNMTISVAAADTKPVIVNQRAVIINEDASFTLTTGHLVVTNADKYPQGYRVSAAGGENYAVNNGIEIVPLRNFHGNLFVPVTVTDGRETSEPFMFQISVRPVNDPPVVSLDTTAIRAGTSEPIMPLASITVTDVDNDSLALAEISLSAEEYVSGSDILGVGTASSLRGVFDAANGVLAIIGRSSIDAYKSALASIQYELASSPAANRQGVSLQITVSDGEDNSKMVSKRIVFSGTSAGAFDIPTGFTPNGDLVNDTWSIRPVSPGDYDDAVIRIYNRAGLLVFEASGLSSEWDGVYNGNVLPPDVYFYTIDLKTPSNETNLRGMVTILR